jgi:hypothetical protein
VTRELCTLFDSGYLFKAVAMYRSLERSCPDFHLTAFCFDDRALEVLELLELPDLTTVSLAELERADPALHAVKASRTSVEYCWTATPALPRVLLDRRRELDEVTYVDADLLFFSDPEPLWREMGDASVLITPHRYSPEYRHHEIHGIYNVQFLCFRRDPHGRAALDWWHDRCVEWCYNRLEDGKLGDQKYLDDWPERFAGVHVLEHRGGGLAPWNVSSHALESGRGGGVLVDGDPLVFFHYIRVRVLDTGDYLWRLPGFVLTPEHERLLYEPYFRALDAAKEEVWRVAPGFDGGIRSAPGWRERLTTARVTLSERAIRRVPRLARLQRLS